MGHTLAKPGQVKHPKNTDLPKKSIKCRTDPNLGKRTDQIPVLKFSGILSWGRGEQIDADETAYMQFATKDALQAM